MDEFGFTTFSPQPIPFPRSSTLSPFGNRAILTSANLNDHWLFLSFRMFIAIISIIGNSVILYIALRYKDFRRSNSNCLIALLALGDLCLGFGLFIRGLYSIQVIIDNIYIYETTFCIWISLPQIYGIAFSYIIFLSMALDRCLAIVNPIRYVKNRLTMQIWFSFLIGVICPTIIFGLSLTSDLHANISQCAIGSSTKLFDKISSIYGFIIAALVIFLYSLALIFLHKRLSISRIGSNGSNLESILKTEKRVFTYVGIILGCFLFFCILPVVSLIILQSFNVPSAWVGYFSVFAGLGSGINSCIGIFVYLRKHHEIQKYLSQILPSWLFNGLSGKGGDHSTTKIVFVQSTASHHK